MLINGLPSEVGHDPRGDLASEMESPAAVDAARGANGKAVQLASQIIADFIGEVHSAALIRAPYQKCSDVIAWVESRRAAA